MVKKVEKILYKKEISEKQNKSKTLKLTTITLKSKYLSKLLTMADIKREYNELIKEYDPSDINIVGLDFVGYHTIKGYTESSNFEDEEETYWQTRVKDPKKYDKYLLVQYIIKK